MKIMSAFFAGLLCSLSCFAQTKPESDPYKPVLDRLANLTVLPLAEWQYHTDIPHPEDAGLNDAEWQTVKTREGWKTGTRVLRRWVEIPEKINGYAARGAKVTLELYFGSDNGC
jgi:hypothetical protein